LLFITLQPLIKPDRNEEEIKAAFRDMMADVLNPSNPEFGDYNILQKNAAHQQAIL
jgi:hypothetical protein